MNLQGLDADTHYGENSHLKSGVSFGTILLMDDISPSFEDDPCCPCPWGYGSVNKCRSANILEKVLAGKIPVILPCLRILEEETL